MLPGLLHPAFSIGFFFPHESQGMQGEKSRILPAAILHALIHPGDTGFGIPEHSFVIREMEDLTPDAFHCGAHQLRLGVEVVVDGAHRYTAGRCHRADAHSDQPCCRISSRLVWRICSLDVTTVFTQSAPFFNLNNVHYTHRPLVCQGEIANQALPFCWKFLGEVSGDGHSYGRSGRLPECHPAGCPESWP